MRLMNFLQRGIALKSNRSQDPVVVTNIKLSTCQDLSEVYKIVNERPLQRVNLFFTLRIMARLIQQQRGEVKNLYSEDYNKIIKMANHYIPDLNSLEMCDLSYFIKITQEYGKENLLIDTSIYDSKLKELYKSNSFTYRQGLSVLNYSQVSGLPIHDLFIESMNLTFKQYDIACELNEFKHLSRSLRLQRVGIDEDIFDKFYKIFYNHFEKGMIDLNSNLFYLRNFLIIDSFRMKTRDYSKVLEGCLAQFDLFSENDYQMLIKIYYDNPGLLDKKFLDQMTERVGLNLEKNSARLSNPFLIDLMPYLSKDQSNDTLMDNILKSLWQKVKSKELRITHLSKLCSACSDLPPHKINHLFDQKLLNSISRLGFYDIILFRNRFEKTSYFKQEKISTEKIEDYINQRSLKALLSLLNKFSGSENPDILVLNELIVKKFLKFIEYSTMNARCMIGHFNEARVSLQSQDKNITIVREKINEMMLKDFDHTNLFYFITTNLDQKRLHEYIFKFKDSINSVILAKSLIENCKIVNSSIFDFLLSSIYSDDYALAYLVHQFRKGTLQKSTCKVPDPQALQNCKIKDMYKDDFAKICELLSKS